MKDCTKCGLQKQDSEFYASPSGRPGRLSACIDCIKSASQNRRDNRRDTHAQRVSKGLCGTCGGALDGQLRNRATGTKKKMCQKCPDYNASKMEGYRKHRIANNLCIRCGKQPPKSKTQTCEKCTVDCSKGAKERDKKRFFLKRAGSGVLRRTIAVAKTLASLWRKQRGLCALTGQILTRENAHVDHILAVSKGGTNECNNLRWVTKDANLAKQALSDADFLVLCKQVVSHAEREKSE